MKPQITINESNIQIETDQFHLQLAFTQVISAKEDLPPSTPPPGRKPQTEKPIHSHFHKPDKPNTNTNKRLTAVTSFQIKPCRFQETLQWLFMRLNILYK